MPWYVERAYPGESPWKGAALNGFMVSITNLRATAALLRMPTADPVGHAPAPRHGSPPTWPTRAPPPSPGTCPTTTPAPGAYYGLLTPGHPWRTYLADLNYHCYHVRLLTQLADDYPGRRLRRARRHVAGVRRSRAGPSCPAR